MKAVTPDIRQAYAEALYWYLSTGGEEALMSAYALGRQAMSQELGVLDLALLHHQALTKVWGDSAIGEATAIQEAGLFLNEALSSFEITHRGFREATEVMNRVIRFATVLCHELRTPLTSILTSAGMLSELLGVDPASPEGKLLNNVVASAVILKSRTDDLVDIVGFQSGTVSLRMENINIANLLTAACQRLDPQVRQAGMELRAEVSPELPALRADSSRLEQVLSNLVQNAIRYASEGKCVDLRATATDRAVVIEVQDYGPGISLWDRVRLFQPYFRGEVRRDEIPGLGVGLMLCRQIVEAHGGNISLESEAGKGSLFRVNLPRLAPTVR